MLNWLGLRILFITFVLLGGFYGIVREVNAEAIGSNLTISPLFKTNSTSKSSSKVWLHRLSEANTKQALKAEVIYQGYGQIKNSFSIIRGVNQGIQFERLTYSNVALGELVRVGKQLYEKKGENVKRVENLGIGSGFSRDMNIGAAAKKNYKIKVNISHIEKIVERPTVLLVFIPQDRFRYGHRIWLDKASAVLLKSETFDLKGSVLEQVQVTSLELLKSLDGTVIKFFDQYKRLDSNEVKSSKSVGQSSNFNIDNKSQQSLEKKRLWHWGWLPDGFSATYHGQNNALGTGKLVEFSILSDGLAHISIFVELSDTGYLQKAYKASGLTSAVSRSLRIHGKVYSTTVVGEVPLMTLERIASSLSER